LVGLNQEAQKLVDFDSPLEDYFLFEVVEKALFRESGELEVRVVLD
jgi:hypothetical protein